MTLIITLVCLILFLCTTKAVADNPVPVLTFIGVFFFLGILVYIAGQ